MTMKRNRAVVMAAVTLMAVMVAAAPQAVAAKTKQERCLAKAARAVGHAIDPADYAIQLGTSRRDRFTPTAGQDLICGFGGRDHVKPATAPLTAGDIFIGGPGDDLVKRLDGGIVIGGRGQDIVKRHVSGTFMGSDGRDLVLRLLGGTFRGGEGNDEVVRLLGGTFRGERGHDIVDELIDGLFVGGAFWDFVFELEGGTFRGGGGEDFVGEMVDGVYDGGARTDAVFSYEGGTLISVEECTPAPTFSCP